jgi:glycosyltransferase involved in cell wall biosynthesis
MRLLIVTDAYPPEIRSSSHLMIELAEQLRDRGHHVHVLTGWPAYNLSAQDRTTAFKPSMIEDGIHVVRVKTLPHHNVGFILRGIAQLTLPMLFLIAFWRRIKEPIDGVIVYTPPLPLAFVGSALRMRGVRYLLNVQDIFPQNAIDLGVLKNNALITFFRWMESQAYRSADVVTAHSKANAEFLKRTHPALATKVSVLHNWVDITPYANATGGAYDFRKEWGLTRRYVLLFAGVIGPSQALDVVLDAAGRLRDLEDLVFLLVGDGTEKARLEERARTEGLNNVLFKPFVSREQYPDLLRIVDVGIVTLSTKNKTPVVPGKILGYMSGAKPVAAFLNAESDGHAIIRSAGCGYSCNSDESEKIDEIFRHLHAQRDNSNILGRLGAEYVSNHFEKAVIVTQIEKLLQIQS